MSTGWSWWSRRGNPPRHSDNCEFHVTPQLGQTKCACLWGWAWVWTNPRYWFSLFFFFFQKQVLSVQHTVGAQAVPAGLNSHFLCSLRQGLQYTRSFSSQKPGNHHWALLFLPFPKSKLLACFYLQNASQILPAPSTSSASNLVQDRAISCLTCWSSLLPAVSVSASASC